MGIRSTLGGFVANRALTCRVRDLTEDALDSARWARPGDLAALKRDLAQVDAPTVALAERLSALEAAAASLEEAIATLTSHLDAP